MAALVSLAAGEAPPLIPTRDVDVTYDLPQYTASGAAGAMLTERLRWDTSAHRLRIDPPGSGGLYSVVDYATHRFALVRPTDRSVLEGPAPAAAMPGRSAAPYAARGAASVGGRPCSEWATIDTEQHPVTVCVTTDGVVLRVQRDGRTLLAARDVTYAPQPASLFDLPAGYRHAPLNAGAAR